MSKLRLASVALLALASTGLLFGSMGFSSVAADRGVSVAVADDDSSLVGYDSDAVAVTGNERVDLVTVTNRLSSEASVTNVTVTTSGDDDNVVVSNVSKPTLGPGEAEAVAADVHCPGNRDVPITVSVTVEAEGVTAAISGDTTTRSFSLDCGGEGESSGPRFTGAGNFEFGATDAETVNVTYWSPSEQSSDASFDEWGPAEVKTWKKLNGQVDNGPKFVAVYVHEWDTTYVHPGFDRANGTVDWGTGDAVVEDGRFDPTSD
jgi:hypothetical protein